VGLDTTFSWSTADGGVSELVVTTNNHLSVIVITSANSARLPDLTPFTASYPVQAAGSWHVIAFSPATVDALAGPPTSTDVDVSSAAWSGSRSFSFR